MTIQQEHWNTPAQGGNRRISVIGCGRWGTFLAWYLERSGQQVCLYGREGSPRMDALVATRTNSGDEIRKEAPVITKIPPRPPEQVDYSTFVLTEDLGMKNMEDAK